MVLTCYVILSSCVRTQLFSEYLDFGLYTNEPRHEISNNVVCATSKYSDQSAETRSLIRAFASRLNILLSVKLLAEQHMELLSFKEGCTGSFESTLVKIQVCWKSHVALNCSIIYVVYHQAIGKQLYKT